MRIVEPLTDAERVRFIAAARQMVGTKFRHRGRTARGLDCIGLVAWGLAAVDRTVIDRDHYGRNPDPERDELMQVCIDHFGAPVGDMSAGDVVAMSWRQEHGVPRTNHLAIVFDYPYGGFAVVHALKENESVRAHRLSDDWLGRIDAVFRP